MKGEILKEYQDCINRIEDLLEYRYRCMRKDDIRTEIMQHIDAMTANITALNKAGK